MLIILRLHVYYKKLTFSYVLFTNVINSIIMSYEIN